jgi:[acyl-carrier-protein] S-malonyltransferase
MIAVLFPGQGSQHVGMGEELLEQFPRFAQAFEEASDVLGYDMKDLCLNGPEDKLGLTEYTQPALLTMSFGTYRVVKDMGEMKPGVASGHSVGEYAALVASGVITFSEALRLVQFRGKLMQESVPVGEGGMLAVMGLDAGEVKKLCTWACKQTKNTPLEPANYNSPAQTVVSGRQEIIDWVVANFKPDKIGSSKTKVRLIPLKVSAPFHCTMMKKAEKEMARAINDLDFKPPQFGIAQNFSGQIETDPEVIKTNLIAQISGPVRWVECVAALEDAGVELMGEFGPGKVLTGLIKKINPDFICVPLNSLADLKSFDRQVVSLNKKMERQAAMGGGYGDL